MAFHIMITLAKRSSTSTVLDTVKTFSITFIIFICKTDLIVIIIFKLSFPIVFPPAKTGEKGGER